MPRATFFSSATGGHTDHRRKITDLLLPEGMKIPFDMRQIKIVEMTDEAVRTQLAVGNHFHTEESGRSELFIVDGPQDVPVFLLRYREERDGEVKEMHMRKGDSCLFPPGVSHAFIGLVAGATLYGLSNTPYDKAHDTPDQLF